MKNKTMHEKTEMELIDRDNRIHESRLNGRKWRVWFWVYRCPVCLARKYPLNNTTRPGQKFYCSGGK